jgi:beta-lactamase superfamily II metal-dependent hydrolase
MRQLLLTLALALPVHAQLRIYAIDVEGGKSTLFVSPSGESMLVDTGYDGFNSRDAKRIEAAAKDAGIHQIDYLVITHYHHDHVGGVRQLAARLPIRTYVDHGDKNFESVKDNGAVFKAYLKQRGNNPHLEVKAGDAIPIKDIQVQVVTAAGKAIAAPLPGGGQPNPNCATYEPIKADTGENAHSIGMLITYGSFRAVDLGDLYWNQEHDLACPADKIGPVDLYLTTHHGKKTSSSPQMVFALRPKVAVMNNGPTTGGAPQAWHTIHSSPGLLDLWQLHYAEANDKQHNTSEPYIANLTDRCNGDWIQVTAQSDGSFTVLNNRNHFAKTYSH